MGKRLLPAVQSPDVLDFISHSASQTERIGYRLGEHIQPGDILLFVGDVGVGKTQLIKGIVQGMGSSDRVTSPSFVLVNEYTAGKQRKALPIYHVDLYRIDTPSELATIGLEELWDETGVCLIEWAERAEGWIPQDHLAIYMQYLDETKRVLRFEPQGERYFRLVELLKTTAFA
jgi:tRNA threonylcarbamoyladenosine biosynthesis protein TsaE